MDSSENNFNQMPSIKTLQAFEQTARFGNVAKAAEHLNLTPSAVSHQTVSYTHLTLPTILRV